MGAIPLHDAQLVDAPALLPPGEYQAYYTQHETAIVFHSAKVFVHFRVHGGDYDRVKLYRAYRVHSLKGKPRKGGSIRLRHSHELFRQFVRLTPSGRERPDRISLGRLRGCLLRISVRTVKKDSRQRALPEALQYSVVDEIIAVEAGQL